MSNLAVIESEDLFNRVTGSNFHEVLENAETDDLENKLAVYINELSDRDVSRLVNMLYRIDVSEEKLKKALQNEDKTKSSGKTIAKLILERQLQKLEYRKQFSGKKIDL